MLIVSEAVRRREQRVIRGNRTIVLRGQGVLLFCLVTGGIPGCVSPEVIEMGSYDPTHDQTAIAGYYKSQAEAMREKANAQATASTRYEALFGPEADLVSGARLLRHYYEQTAKELEGLAESHASVARKTQHHPAVP